MPNCPHKQVSIQAVRALICGMMILTAAGSASADVKSGNAIARQWCANCHAVTPGQQATDAAPSFSEIAARADLSRQRLQIWLSTPHAGMPDLSLSRPDINAVIDYLQALPH